MVNCCFFTIEKKTIKYLKESELTKETIEHIEIGIRFISSRYISLQYIEYFGFYNFVGAK